VPPDEQESTDQDGDKTPLSPPDLPEGGDSQPRIKYVIADVPVYVVAERVQFYGPDGKLITESLRDYTRSCVRKQYASMHDFLRRWSSAEQKKIIVEELAAQGVLWEPLAKEVENKLGKALDAFDLICHVAFDQPPLSRRERAENVKKRNYFAKYGEQAREVLEALLEKYADTGIENIEDIKVLTIDPLSRLGTPPELVGAFGGKPQYLKALHELEEQLYQ
jgi:type I restriction enzyme R subunit